MANKETTYLDCVEINPGGATHSVIWLHGLGADGRDFLPIVPELKVTPHTRYVFPNAPVRPVTINGGAPMRAWYDISMGRQQVDVPGIEEAVQATHNLVAREIQRGIPPSHIVLAGFSQGGMVIQLVALTASVAVAGVLALSTRLYGTAIFAERMTTHNHATPWLVMHGRHDDMIPHSSGKKDGLDALVRLGCRATTWRDYDMGHSLCPEQLRDIDAWLWQRLTPAAG